MTDITKEAVIPPRSFLSQDAIQVFYRLLAALLICAVLAVLSDSFLSLGNILNVLRQASLTFFIASGLTLVVLTAGLDLSVGANVALSACIAGTVIHKTGSPALGILTGLACGGLVGLLNGIMVTALRIPSFIATYGMLWVLNGLTYWYMAGETLHGFPAGFRQIGSGYLFGLPIPVYLLLVFLGIGTFFAQRTIWGQEIYAIGANPVAARLSGIPVARRLLLVYAVSGIMAGLASIIFLSRLNSADRGRADRRHLAVRRRRHRVRHLHRRADPDAGAERHEPALGQRQLAAARHRHHRHCRGRAGHEDPPAHAMSFQEVQQAK
jgi:ribose transport system permease protein